MTTSYADDVRAWSGFEPWKGRPNLKHKTGFTAADVVTDGAGNITAMPALLHKPCFGRPEVLLRQGVAVKKFTTGNGKEVVPLSRCDRCAFVGVRAACESVVTERVTSDPVISAAFDNWSAQTKLHPADRAYTGPIGRYWTAFREAIAARGPFDSVNDAVVAAHNAESAERDVELFERRKNADLLRKRNHRQTLKDTDRKPSREFIGAALAERARRAKALGSLAGRSDSPLTVMKLSPAGCEITADVWLGDLLLRQIKRKLTAGNIARWMVKNNRNHGVAFDTLRTRIPGDLRRVRLLEKDAALWGPFDPDA